VTHAVHRLIGPALVVGLLMAPAATFAQDSKSAALATELTSLLDQMKLDSIASQYADQVVGALYIPGTQLLVVTGKSSAHFDPMLKQKAYRDVYIDLSSASVAGSKVFVIDQNCDGLASKPDGGAPADTWEAGTQALTFDGEWRKAKMTEDAYGKAFADADERYARLLALLIAQVK